MMRSSRRFAAVIGLLLAASASAVPAMAKEQLTVEKLMTLDRVSSPTLSEDGAQIAYVVETVDPATYDSRFALFVAPSTNIGAARSLLSGEKGAPQFRWSADGATLYYLSSQSGSKQLWAVTLADGAKRQLTSFPVGITAFLLGKDEKLLLTAHDVYPDCTDLACTDSRAKTDKARKDSGLLYKDGEAPRFYASYGDGRFTNLFTSTLPASGMLSQAAQLTPGYRYDVMENAFGLQWDFTIAPDGGTIYFASRPSGSSQGDELPKVLHSVKPGQGSAFAPMIADPAQSVYSPRVSPDGKNLAYLKAAGTQYTSPKITIWIRDLASGADRMVPNTPDEQISDLNWSPDGKSLYVAAGLKGYGRLFSISAAKGGYAVIGAGGSIGDMSLAAGRLAFVQSTMTTSPEIVVVDAARPTKPLTKSSFGKTGSNRFDLGDTVEFSFAGWNGESVQGFLVKPANFDPEKKYPIILNMHGGPNGAFADRWDGGTASAQLLAGRGYAVVMMNPHGSSGYGTAFGQSVLGHWGDRPLEDLQKGWAHIVAASPWLDTDRACAMGGSYGGYLTLLIAGRWADPWKCLVERAGIFDARSLFYGNDITAYDKLSFVAEPWKDDSYESQNPVTYVKNWKAPIFIFGGAEDYRVPIDQSIGAYGAARLMNVPSQFLIYPDEPHGIRKPHNGLRLFEETMTWLDKWTAATPGKND
jgi:acylaminoacyl-peptidase